MIHGSGLNNVFKANKVINFIDSGLMGAMQFFPSIVFGDALQQTYPLALVSILSTLLVEDVKLWVSVTFCLSSFKMMI
jgi:hypothetical protein